MTASRDVYAHKALAQIPRLLGNQDRNPFSPTYGCFHRDYWLDKTSDFPDAVRQFGVQSLALVYTHDFPGNNYKGQPKIRDWAIAGLDFWARIQHNDGSFDEFYPYERGWVGPTAFTTFTSIEAYQLLKDEMPAESAARVRETIRRAAHFICGGESEEDHLANHHAMACLAVWKAYELLQEPALKAGFQQLWQGFLSYHNAEEGWSREYDGVDPGYLSATVSFLAKIYQSNPDPALLEVMQQSATFCSYFAYPNGFYAGSMGSRNTLHFYAHGFEVLAQSFPLAASIAEKMLQGLAEDKLVPPDIISDRYVFYRVPEFLQAYLDYTPRPVSLPPLPYEQEPFTRYYPQSRIFVANRPKHYILANLAKGGVVKVFDRQSEELLLNDCGSIGQLQDGQVVTSQWIDPHYTCRADEHGFEVVGNLNTVPSNKLFNPLKNIVFRSMLVALGWNTHFSHMLKGNIRKVLMLGRRPIPVRFRRSLHLDEQGITLHDQIQTDGQTRFTALSLGDEFFVRYVPQSRYFQSQELGISGWQAEPQHLDALNQGTQLERVTQLKDGKEHMTTTTNEQRTAAVDHGVYDIAYYHGRQQKRQLIYRLQRRTDEVAGALQNHTDGPLQTIIDVGTADSLMLESLQKRFETTRFIGIDMSFALLQARQIAEITKVQGNAQILPVHSGVGDAIIATAIIEHLPDPALMLRECAHILRPGGLLIITTPDPFLEHVSSLIGLLKDAGHHYTFTLDTLQTLIRENGFEVVEARKFMFSPVGFPAEKMIEKILRTLHLDLVMANQFVVARRGS